MMGYIPWEDFWWNNITGARTVVDRVALALLDNKMVVLKVPSDLPWRHAMRGAIQVNFNERTDSRSIVIETIDAVDHHLADFEPGRFILKQYASSDIRAGYREKARKTIQEYISEWNVLKNRIIWVKGLDETGGERWLQFCRGFSPKTAANGLFVLEVHGNVPAPDSKFIAFIDFDACVSSYDVQQFNSAILDERRTHSNKWKRYISTTAALVCGVDAEVSECLLRLVDFRTDTAMDGIRRIAETGDFDRRGAGKNSDHPLGHDRSGNTAELEHRIWTAQIQVLFPIIELERQKLIEKWWRAIEDALNRYTVEQFGVTLKDPAEVELGTLCYMLRSKMHSDYRMLFMPDDTDRRRIMFLHACRNKLAHMTCCSPEEVAGLLD